MAKGATGRSISGIYVPIQLDTQYIAQDIQRLKVQLGTMGAAMGGSLDAALNPKNLMKNFKTLIESLGNIRDATTALGRLEPFGNFQRALNWITPEMKQLAQTLGITTQAQRQLLEQMARNTAIQQQVNGLRQLERAMGLSRAETLKLADSLGMVTDKIARLQYMGSQGNTGIMERIFGKNASSTISGALGAMGVAGGAYGMVETAKGMTETAMKVDNLKTAFESIYGSSEKAGKQLEFVKNVSYQLGLSFISSADNAKKFFAAMQGTQIASDANKIFLAFSNAGAALKLTKDEMNSVFLALSQMASKGKVQAEELRSQLAERFPGAVSLFAKAIGVSTIELDNMLQKGTVGLEHLSKFADEVQKTYAAGAVLASHSLQAELNRLETAWVDLSAALINTDELASGVRMLGEALNILVANAPKIKSIAVAFLEVSAAILGARGIVSVITSIITAFSTLGGAAAVAKAGMAGFGGVLATILGPSAVAVSGLAALGLAIYKVTTYQSEGEKIFNQYRGQVEALGKQADLTKKAISDMSNKEKEVRFDTLTRQADEAKAKFDKIFSQEVIFSGFSDALQQNITLKSISFVDQTLQGMQAEFKGTEAQKLYTDAQTLIHNLYANLDKAYKDGKRGAALEQIINDFDLEMQKMQNSMHNLQVSDKAKQGIAGLGKTVVVAAREFALLKSAMDDFSKSADDSVEAAARSNVAFDSILKMTKTSAYGKEYNAKEDMKNMITSLGTLQDGANAAQEKMATMTSYTANNKKEWEAANLQIDRFHEGLALVASEAIKSGMDFNTLSNLIELVGQAANWTKEKVDELKQMFKGGISTALVDTMDKAIAELDKKTALIKTKKGVKESFNLIDKATGGLLDGKATISAIQAGNVSQIGAEIAKVTKDSEKALEVAKKIVEYQQGMQKDADEKAAARKSRGTRTRIMSNDLKEIETLKKKIADFQSDLQHDPSLKYLAEVEGELVRINKILENGKGTAAEKEELRKLAEQYKQYAKMRYEKMKEDEKRQKAISAMQTFGKQGNNLSDINAKVSPSVQVNAFEAEYKIAKEALERFVAEGTITWAQYYDQIDALNTELQMKTEAANGSIIANLGLKFEESYQSVVNWQTQISDTVVAGISSMSDAFANFLVTGMKNTDDLAKAFSNMVSSMISDLAKLFMKMMIMSAISKLFKGLFGGLSWDNQNRANNDYDYYMDFGYKKGGVFSGGGLNNYSNSVVSQPTVFSYGNRLTPFARGGVMGEAGPEAIMPLVRTRGGNLGVRAEGMGGISQTINVNVINNSDAKVETRQDTDVNGNVNLDIMIDNAVARKIGSPGSASYRAIQGTFGAQPILANR